MKWLALAVIWAALMVNGQESKPHSNTHTSNSASEGKTAQDATGQQVVIVNQQAPQREQQNRPPKPPSYLSRLFSPENLPNVALVFVGIGGIVIAICTLFRINTQAIEMRRQRIEIKAQRLIMHRQLKSMQEQSGHMQGQLSEMQESRKIENRTLILQYRPKIIVRNAKALQFSFDLGKPWECELSFMIVNIGGSPAKITTGTNICMMSCVAPDTGSIDFKTGDTTLIDPLTLQPGEEVVVQESLPSGVLFDLEWENFRQGLQGKNLRYLFLMGRIFYTDDLNIPRSTGISRTYNPKTKAFTPRKDEEDEYAD